MRGELKIRSVLRKPLPPPTPGGGAERVYRLVAFGCECHRTPVAAVPGGQQHARHEDVIADCTAALAIRPPAFPLERGEAGLTFLSFTNSHPYRQKTTADWSTINTRRLQPIGMEGRGWCRQPGYLKAHLRRGMAYEALEKYRGQGRPSSVVQIGIRNGEAGDWWRNERRGGLRLFVGGGGERPFARNTFSNTYTPCRFADVAEYSAEINTVTMRGVLEF